MDLRGRTERISISVWETELAIRYDKAGVCQHAEVGAQASSRVVPQESYTPVPACSRDRSFLLSLERKEPKP